MDSIHCLLPNTYCLLPNPYFPMKFPLTFLKRFCYNNIDASVLEQADNRDLKSCALWACGFDPRHSHKKHPEGCFFVCPLIALSQEEITEFR